MNHKATEQFSRKKDGVYRMLTNNSALTELIFWDECHLSQKSLYFINRTLERNDGKLTIEGI